MKVSGKSHSAENPEEFIEKTQGLQNLGLSAGLEKT